MAYKRYFLIFIFSFSISVLVYLALDFNADLQVMTGVSLLSGILFTLIVMNFEKSFRRWYRERFDKAYQYNKIKPITKEKKVNEDEDSSAK